MSDCLRRALGALAQFALPTALAQPIATTLGRRIVRGGLVGLSPLLCDLVACEPRVAIVNLKFVRARRLVMRREPALGRMNVVNGPISLEFAPRTALRKEGRVLRAPKRVTTALAHLRLGILAKITSNQHFDCTRSIDIGDHAKIAHAGSQSWTQGYVQGIKGPSFYRIDRRTDLEHNGYVCSASFISVGVRIGQGSPVGGGTSVARSLPALRVHESADIRALARPEEPDARPGLVPTRDACLVERVFAKLIP